MANCMTCRHNDRATKYCSLKRAHTDLGYVLNCVAWAPTAEAEIRRIRTENAKLREYAKLMHDHIKECCDVCGECSICDIDALTRSLGIEVEE